jgi:hypothetical protein
MKHCESIDIETTPTGAIFRGKQWPEEIDVDRNLLDYLPGPHVSFGRYGILRFTVLNGYAVYRRFEDKPGGWNYRLVENQLRAEAPAASAAEPQLARAASRYRHVESGKIVDAFQWLPHAMPPVELPDWFMRENFKHNDKGELTIAQSGGSVTALPGHWLLLHDGIHLGIRKPETFAHEYVAAPL